MALRCLLVSLVASLGFELPSNQDVTSWTVLGRNWVSGRAVDLSALQAEASGWLGLGDPTIKPSPERPTPTDPEQEAAAASTTGPDDLAFESIGEGMALAFASDLETARDGDATPAPVSAPAPAELVAAAEPQPMPDLDPMALAFPAPSADSTDEEVVEPTDPSMIRADRLASAFRLTREAVQAWATLVQPVSEDSVTSR